MKHNDINQMVVANVTSAFRNAPTPIYLHMQLGENPSDPTFSQRGNITQHFTSVRYYKTSSLPTYVGLATLKQLYFGTVAERQNASSLACPNNSVPSGLVPPLSSSYSYNCLTAKRFAFHYAMFANNIYGYP